MLVSLCQADIVLLAGVLVGASILIPPLIKTLSVGLTFIAGPHHWWLHGCD